ncbi:RNA-binding protein 48-like [Penaeus chinensis]|uniref:RNA-binding protein 48-like n=1 Tax=Penaeus chinensis TaxID=139456 RepID=UPI001FB6E973|nr:RNA-binding protein 48-like [Penaeus chinensis]
MGTPGSVERLPHHEQMEFCLTRAKYRQGRKLTAVKVYTVNDESKFLIVTGIPAIKICNEVESLCLKYGHVEFIQPLPGYPCEAYTEAFLVKYARVKSACFAKVQLDGKSFYGGVLHVFYAPELESVGDTREKLQERRKSIAALTRYSQDPSLVNPSKKQGAFQYGNSARYLSRLKPQPGEKPVLSHSITDSSRSGGGISEGNPLTSSCNDAKDQEVFEDICHSEDSIAVSCRQLTRTNYPGSSSSVTSAEQSASYGSSEKRTASDTPFIEINKKKIKLFGDNKVLLYK